jgi:hypothetical protein
MTSWRSGLASSKLFFFWGPKKESKSAKRLIPCFTASEILAVERYQNFASRAIVL